MRPHPSSPGELVSNSSRSVSRGSVKIDIRARRGTSDTNFTLRTRRAGHRPAPVDESPLVTVGSLRGSRWEPFHEWPSRRAAVRTSSSLTFSPHGPTDELHRSAHEGHPPDSVHRRRSCTTPFSGRTSRARHPTLRAWHRFSVVRSDPSWYGSPTLHSKSFRGPTVPRLNRAMLVKTHLTSRHEGPTIHLPSSRLTPIAGS